MHVRTATHDDLESVAGLHERAVRAVDRAYTPRQLDAWDHPRDPDDYPVDDGRKRLVVAERDGWVVGYGQLDLDAGELQAVYVDPEHADTGVGSALVAHLEGVATGRDYRRVELLASKNAVGFYRSAGYEPTGTESVESPNGVELGCVRMAKRLNSDRTEWGRLPV